MKKFLLTILLTLFCLSAHAASLESAFQLGEKQNPRLDRLLPDVARQIAFNRDSTKLIAEGMGGTVVSWDIKTQVKQIVYTNPKMCRFGFSNALNYLLIPISDGVVVTVDLIEGHVEKLISSAYEHCSLTERGNLAVLSRGNNEIELWDIRPQEKVIVMPRNGVDRSEEIPQKTTRIDFKPQKLYTLNTTLPVRNGLTFSPDKQYFAAAEGTYRDDEGHTAIIEIWNTTGTDQPIRVINTGEILGVWNLIFSQEGSMLAADTQLNAKSGIRVWDVHTGAQLLNKFGFEAYWTRALAFAPNEKPNSTEYIASGDEKGNLRIWKIPGGDPVFWVTYPTGIQALAFSPDGKYLAVALWDTTIQILEWNVNGK